jgi:STE24 endopeptidase
MAAAEQLFEPAEIERGRRYHGPRYAALAANLTLALTVPGSLAAFRPGLPIPWWAEACALSGTVVLAVGIAQLPVSIWSGYLHERRWGLSTQSLGGWASDRAKGAAVGLVLTSAAVLVVVALARELPSTWPLPAAAAAAALVLLLGFVAPLVLEPLFNRFRPLEEGALRERLLQLAELAGAPVRDVLVADASRRTRKLNAYVSGLGASRRVVAFDTLLERAGGDEVAVVVAHELAHRREQHVVKLTLLGMAGSAAAVAVLWAVLREDAADPRNVPLLLLVVVALQVAALPLGAALSRRFERVADRVALELTGAPPAFEAVFRRLAAENVADLDPPRVIRLIATHPPIPERIAAARRCVPAELDPERQPSITLKGV